MNYMHFNKITPDMVIAAYKNNKYPLFTNGDYNVNLFAIRNECDRDADKFNDMIGLLYKVHGNWVLKKYDASVDPGIKYRENPINDKGTAIVVPGYYRSAFVIGLHQGKYQALRQNIPLPLYRDNDKDKSLDFDSKIYTEMAGINLHRASASGKSTIVGSHSAGCQVIADINDFNEFMGIINKSAKIYGDKFSYALFTESQFFM